MVEVALMAPWIFFLFIGVFDFGVYAYSCICAQNAARAAALSNASNGAIDNTSACLAALAELNRLPNTAGETSNCPTTAGTVTDARPVAVWVDKLCQFGCIATCADCGVDAAAISARATVVYRTIQLIPIPGVLAGRTTITRAVEMRYMQ